METFLWITLWVMLIPGGLAFIAVLGKRTLSRQLSEPEEVDEWAEYKRLATLVRERKAKEIEEWTKEFQALVQSTCKRHEYKGERHHGWYACIHCGHEQEWTYRIGCSCRVVSDYSVVDGLVRAEYALTARSPHCTIHGRTPAREAAVERGRATYSGDNYLKRGHFGYEL